VKASREDVAPDDLAARRLRERHGQIDCRIRMLRIVDRNADRAKHQDAPNRRAASLPDGEEPFGNEKVLDRRAGSLPSFCQKARMGG
jgi:hypothetical protein